MDLLEKISKRTAQVGVIGLGYVGLPLAVEKAKAGYRVTGFDIQQEKVDKVNSGINYIGDVVPEDLKTLVRNDYLKATTDFSRINQCDVVSICVPTPLDKFKQPDLSYVVKTAETISRYIKKDTLVILESTTYPGTTEEVLKPILESSGLKVGKDIFLAFSPERVDPGNLIYKTKNTPKVVGGCTPLCTERAKAIYENVLDAEVFTVSSPKEAEMTKILENTFRIVNCALANEMAIVCEKMGINIWEVIAAAATKPFGFVPFYPGPGVGGHCIPIDPFYLTYKARSVDYHTRLIELAGEINDYMPEYVVHRISELLNEVEKPLKNSSILFLGVSYKGDIDDLRESPALKVWEFLEKRGSRISFYDPYCSSFGLGDNTFNSLKEQPEEYDKYDIVVITSGHKKNVDYERVLNKASLILDTKNIISQVLGIDEKAHKNLHIL
jgi:nucleotide sugar dehydrogenase